MGDPLPLLRARDHNDARNATLPSETTPHSISDLRQGTQSSFSFTASPLSAEPGPLRPLVAVDGPENSNQQQHQKHQQDVDEPRSRAPTDPPRIAADVTAFSADQLCPPAASTADTDLGTHRAAPRPAVSACCLLLRDPPGGVNADDGDNSGGNRNRSAETAPTSSDTGARSDPLTSTPAREPPPPLLPSRAAAAATRRRAESARPAVVTVRPARSSDLALAFTPSAVLASLREQASS
ncbi:hypothetical protein HK405_012868, partial [Cladochytrium tenue]